MVKSKLPREAYDTGLLDMYKTPIYEGDRVRYNLQGDFTKKEYWNPEYIVVWDPPSFTLKWVGGGKSGDDTAFKLKYGGSNGDLEIIFDRETRKSK